MAMNPSRPRKDCFVELACCPRFATGLPKTLVDTSTETGKLLDCYLKERCEKNLPTYWSIAWNEDLDFLNIFHYPKNRKVAAYRHLPTTFYLYDGKDPLDKEFYLNQYGFKNHIYTRAFRLNYNLLAYLKTKDIKCPKTTCGCGKAH